MFQYIYIYAIIATHNAIKPNGQQTASILIRTTSSGVKRNCTVENARNVLERTRGNMAASTPVNGDSVAQRLRMAPKNTVTVVLGAQWGDEGKGKIVDLLATDADIVCRCQVSWV